jgi:hypothetical protein
VGALRSYDPSFETPDEGGINGPPHRGSIRARVKPSRLQLAVSIPRSLLELQLRPQRCDLPAARDGLPTCGWSIQLIGCVTLKRSVSSPRDHGELIKLQMRLDTGSSYSVAA